MMMGSHVAALWEQLGQTELLPPQKNILACYSNKSTCVNNKMNDASVPDVMHAHSQSNSKTEPSLMLVVPVIFPQ